MQDSKDLPIIKLIFRSKRRIFQLKADAGCFNFNTDFSEAPESFNGDFNFRIKTKSGGFFKYYGMYDSNRMGVKPKA